MKMKERQLEFPVTSHYYTSPCHGESLQSTVIYRRTGDFLSLFRYFIFIHTLQKRIASTMITTHKQPIGKFSTIFPAAAETVIITHYRRHMQYNIKDDLKTIKNTLALDYTRRICLFRYMGLTVFVCDFVLHQRRRPFSKASKSR